MDTAEDTKSGEGLKRCKEEEKAIGVNTENIKEKAGEVQITICTSNQV